MQLIRNYLSLPATGQYSALELLVRLAVRWTCDCVDEDAVTDYLDLDVSDYLGAYRRWLRRR